MNVEGNSLKSTENCENASEGNVSIFTHSAYANLDNMNSEDIQSITCKRSVESICRQNQSKIVNLKNSTRKLLCLLDRILSDTHSKIKLEDQKPKYVIKTVQCHEDNENCTIYNRLTRKCQCLNRSAYNDFMLQFNESLRSPTCNIGEVIKNMRILKKFLYMGDGYTKNALMFLNEGLSECSLLEKADIIQGCVHADICNIFEAHSIVLMFVSWPCKDENYGDRMTQILAANFVYKIAITEEGKRYFNFNSKIIDEIRHTLKKNASKLNVETIEYLNTTLNSLQQHFAQHLSVSFYCKTNNQGIGTKTFIDLIKRRHEMTMEEVILSLELLNNLSKLEHGKLELAPHFPCLLIILRNILKEYDNSKMNIIVTNLLNNLISKNMVNKTTFRLNGTVMVTNTATEPIDIKSQVMKISGKKKVKKHNVLKMNPDKVLSNTPRQQDMFCHPRIFEISRKMCENTRRRNIIVVPVE